MNTRREYIGMTLTAGFGMIVKKIFGNSNFDYCIDKWADKHAFTFANADFAKEIFCTSAGEKYHSAYPVYFILLPMNDGTVSKYFVEFPRNVRRAYVVDENDENWKKEIFNNMKQWLKNQAMDVYSKLPNVDFCKFYC